MSITPGYSASQSFDRSTAASSCRTDSSSAPASSLNSIAFPAGPMFSLTNTTLSAPGNSPVAFRHSLTNVSLSVVRLMASSSSTLTAPRWLPENF